MTHTRLVFRVHAAQRMAQRSIDTAAVRAVLDGGEVIASYPDDLPFPSRLVLGWVNGRAVHVVAADNDAEGVTVVITVYEPDPAIWTSDFRSRRKP